MSDKKLFSLYLPCFAEFSEFDLFAAKIDAFVFDLLIRRNFSEAEPTVIYGQFEVAPEFEHAFRVLAGMHGLAVSEEIEDV